MNELPDGLYEQLIDSSLRQLLANLPASRESLESHLDDGDSHTVLAQHLGRIIEKALRSEGELAKQIDICNQILKQLPDEYRNMELEEKILDSIFEKRPGNVAFKPSHPDTPLSVSSIFTGTKEDLTLLSQLKHEIRTSDRIEILCSFLKYTGVRIILPELEEFCHRPSTELHIITTTYTGASESKAIDVLSRLPNTQVKVSYDVSKTRLHAKAYLFHRNTGSGSAYIGSSNLSGTALTSGLEWNVKVSQIESPHLWRKVEATFSLLWNDAEFRSYTHELLPELQRVLKEENENGYREDQPFFDIIPFPHQIEILDKLQAEREVHKRHRNLIVAATGTGKTILAAFDYKQFRNRLREESTHIQPTLLFIAHREEILIQSLRSFRQILKDNNFGELWTGRHEPTQNRHLFVTIQTYQSRKLFESFPNDFFDYIVVDEFHHAEAASYQNLLECIKPVELLALTATPERADGNDVTSYFGGYITAEMRLAEAINKQHLAPFQYFIISDHVNLNNVSWRKGGYDLKELETLYRADKSRAELILKAVHNIVVNPKRVKGLGFCVSIRHAEFMAEAFNQNGIPSISLSANSPQKERGNARDRLRLGEICFIFSVDLYNEGVDIPEIDTVLFLRPTESLTVFLQQLGRGLRKNDGKECLTVIDFVGHAHAEFNFEQRFRALMDRPQATIDKEIEAGCLHMPLGCYIQIEREAQRHILDNIRLNLERFRKSDIRSRIKELYQSTGEPPTLRAFLSHYNTQPSTVYKVNSFTELTRDALWPEGIPEPDQEELSKGLRRLCHLDGVDRLARLIRLLRENEQQDYEPLDRIHLEMLLITLFGGATSQGSVRTVETCIHKLQMNPDHANELIELLDWQYDKIFERPTQIDIPFFCPLELHGSYTRDELLVGLGHWSLSRQPAMREGVLHLQQHKADLFLVTLKKTEKEYSASTLYEDYVINQDTFHWQTQSRTGAESDTALRYRNDAQEGHTILLCVREDKRTVDGRTAPYQFLGPVQYVSDEGTKPVTFIWRLKYPLSGYLFNAWQSLKAS